MTVIIWLKPENESTEYARKEHGSAKYCPCSFACASQFIAFGMIVTVVGAIAVVYAVMMM